MPPYFDHPAYLDVVTTVIREEVAGLSWKPEHFLLSIHGLPVAYVERGDIYLEHVENATQLLLERLNWPMGNWSQAFQSPGFIVDCLETIDEIGFEARELFEQAAGELLHQCRCLYDHPKWIEEMRALVVQEGQGRL